MPFVLVQEEIVRLAATFLEAFADELGNKGCNDYDLPDLGSTPSPH